MFNQTAFENELTDRSGHRVKFSREVYFSDNFDFFRKVFIDGKETAFKVNIIKSRYIREYIKIENISV